MPLIANAISIVLSVFLIMALGFVCAKREWLGRDARPILSFLVVKLGLPCMIVYNITTSYTRESLISGAYGLIVPVASISLMWLVAWLLSKALRVPPKRRGVFLCMCVFSNSVFIGVPISTAIFGDAVLSDTLLYYIANTIFFWTAGANALRMSAQESGGKDKPLSATTLKNIFSLPLCSFIFSVILVFLGVSLPKPILDATRYMSGIVTPVSILFIGLVLGAIDFRTIRIDRGQMATVLCRFLLSPALVLAASMVVPLGTVTRNVFIVQSAMPVMTQVSLLTATYKGDVEYATVGTTLTTLLSLLVIPLLSLILPYV